MRAVVIGAGEVGVHVARVLGLEGHEVTVVDSGKHRCETLREELDALVVEGNGASPRVLREVRAGDADLLAAVTNIDEVNIIAALAARQLGTRQTIARVRDPDFFIEEEERFARDVLGIDLVIDPDRLTASDIAEAILLPGAVTVEYFEEGALGLAEVIVTEDSPLVGITLAERERPKPTYIVGYVRRGQASLVTPETRLEPGDHILVTAHRRHLASEVARFAGRTERARDCVIFGGGKVGSRLARELEPTDVRVTVLEANEGRARFLAERLSAVTILHEEGISREALLGAQVDEADAFVACAGDDRANLLAALNAKRLGVGLCIAVVSREEFLPLVDALEVDAAVSPRLITAEAIVRFVHLTSLRALHLLRSGFQALDLEAEAGSRIVGMAIGETRGLLRGWRVGAILRGSEVIIPHGGERIDAGDRVLMLGLRGRTREVEAAFAADRVR